MRTAWCRLTPGCAPVGIPAEGRDPAVGRAENKTRLRLGGLSKGTEHARGTDDSETSLPVGGAWHCSDTLLQVRVRFDRRCWEEVHGSPFPACSSRLILQSSFDVSATEPANQREQREQRVCSEGPGRAGDWPESNPVQAFSPGSSCSPLWSPAKGVLQQQERHMTDCSRQYIYSC